MASGMKELAKKYFTQFGFDTGWIEPKPVETLPDYIAADVPISEEMHRV